MREGRGAARDLYRDLTAITLTTTSATTTAATTSTTNSLPFLVRILHGILSALAGPGKSGKAR